VSDVRHQKVEDITTFKKHKGLSRFFLRSCRSLCTATYKYQVELIYSETLRQKLKCHPQKQCLEAKKELVSILGVLGIKAADSVSSSVKSLILEYSEKR